MAWESALEPSEQVSEQEFAALRGRVRRRGLALAGLSTLALAALAGLGVALVAPLARYRAEAERLCTLPLSPTAEPRTEIRGMLPVAGDGRSVRQLVELVDTERATFAVLPDGHALLLADRCLRGRQNGMTP